MLMWGPQLGVLVFRCLLTLSRRAVQVGELMLVYTWTIFHTPTEEASQEPSKRPLEMHP